MVVATGLTVIDGPVPISVPPHEPIYHFQSAAPFNEPPITLKVIGLPAQVVEGTDDIVGAVAAAGTQGVQIPSIEIE